MLYPLGLQADDKTFVTKTFYLVDMPPAESSIRFDASFFEVTALSCKGEERVSIKMKGNRGRAAEAFFVDNRMQSCRVSSEDFDVEAGHLLQHGC